eukprot:2850346-Prymnesium_polylepis.1
MPPPPPPQQHPEPSPPAPASPPHRCLRLRCRCCWRLMLAHARHFREALLGGDVPRHQGLPGQARRLR